MIAPRRACGSARVLPRPVAERNGITSGGCCNPRSCMRSRERLAPGGYLHAATDWEDYARRDARDARRSEPLLANAAKEFAPRPA